MSEGYVAYQADAWWWPSELRRLVRLLSVAHEGSRPGSGDPSSRGVKTTRSSDYPPGAVENVTDDTVEPAGDMQHCARVADKFRKRIGSLADDLESELQGRGRSKRGWRCPDCGRFQRETARYCDSCGHRRETIRTMRSETDRHTA